MRKYLQINIERNVSYGLLALGFIAYISVGFRLFGSPVFVSTSVHPIAAHKFQKLVRSISDYLRQVSVIARPVAFFSARINFF